MKISIFAKGKCFAQLARQRASLIFYFQMMVLCALNYEFHILDSAFLVHKPGTKLRSPKSVEDTLKENNQTKFINQVLIPEMRALYGNSTCIQSFSYRPYISHLSEGISPESYHQEEKLAMGNGHLIKLQLLNLSKAHL